VVALGSRGVVTSISEREGGKREGRGGGRGERGEREGRGGGRGEGRGGGRGQREGE
jgi:hypothetical protein